MRHKSNIRSILSFCFFAAVFTALFGCGGKAVFDKPLQRIESHVFGYQQEFYHSLRKAHSSGMPALSESGCAMTRIEIQKGISLILSQKQKAEIHMEFKSLSDSLTRVTLKIRGKMANKDTFQENLFHRMNQYMTDVGIRPSNDPVARMIPIFHIPDPKSAQVAYIAPGETITLVEPKEDSIWLSVKLHTGGIGYVQKQNVSLLSLCASSQCLNTNDTHQQN